MLAHRIGRRQCTKRLAHPGAVVPLVVALLLGLHVTAAVGRAQQTVEALVAHLHRAINTHDVDAALAFFADDAVVSFPNPTPPTRYQGTQEVRGWLERDFAQNISVAIENLQVAGDTLTWVARLDSDDLRAIGVTIVGTVEATLRDGRLAMFTFTLNDDTLAWLAAATAPQALPQTGAPALFTPWLLVAAFLLVGLGLWLRRRAQPEA